MKCQTYWPHNLFPCCLALWFSEEGEQVTFIRQEIPSRRRHGNLGKPHNQGHSQGYGSGHLPDKRLHMHLAAEYGGYSGYIGLNGSPGLFQQRRSTSAEASLLQELSIIASSSQWFVLLFKTRYPRCYNHHLCVCVYVRESEREILPRRRHFSGQSLIRYLCSCKAGVCETWLSNASRKRFSNKRHHKCLALKHLKDM